MLASTSLFFSVFQHHAMLVCFLSPFPPFLPLYASTHEVLEIFGQRESGMDVRLICDSGRRTKTRAEVKELLRLFLPHRSLRMVISLRSTAPEWVHVIRSSDAWWLQEWRSAKAEFEVMKTRLLCPRWVTATSPQRQGRRCHDQTHLWT